MRQASIARWRRLLALLPALLVGFCITAGCTAAMLYAALPQLKGPGLVAFAAACLCGMVLGAGYIYLLYRLLHWRHLVLRYVAYAMGSSVVANLLLCAAARGLLLQHTPAEANPGHYTAACLFLSTLLLAACIVTAYAGERARKATIVKPEILIEVKEPSDSI